MIKSLLSKFILVLCFALSFTTSKMLAQQTVFTETFSTPSGSAFTTFGTVGDSQWLVARSGIDYGAKIGGGVLTLTNDATSAANSNGWILASTSTSNMRIFWD